jgi:hypothetical protein
MQRWYPLAGRRNPAADSQRAVQATRSLPAITTIASLAAASGQLLRLCRQHSFEIRTASRGNPAVFSALSPLTVPLLLKALEHGALLREMRAFRRIAYGLQLDD